MRHLRNDIADWWDRNQAFAALAAVSLVVLWVLGIVLMGETELEQPTPTTPAYVHPTNQGVNP